jgi:hypothetical protein
MSNRTGGVSSFNGGTVALERSLINLANGAERREKDAIRGLGANATQGEILEAQRVSQDSQRVMTIATTMLKNMQENLMALIRNLKLN